MSKSEARLQHLKEIVSSLPDSPGVYHYYNDKGDIIYIGKAKNLKRRVSSYFNKNHDSTKTVVLVRQIADIKYIVVDTEEDALLLENNLIKKYRPRYNVLLKDDKTYPWICIKRENFPRVIKTRQRVKDGSLYFGPYSSVPLVNLLLDIIQEIYPLRTCNLALNYDDIRIGKYHVCLKYHIKKCLGPCEGKQSVDSYDKNIQEIKEIIRGNVSTICKKLKEEMQQAASELKFEEAHQIKEKYLQLDKFQSRSTVVSNVITDVDVVAIEVEEQTAYVNFLHVVNGAVVQAYTFEYKKRLDESDIELLQLAIVELREKFQSKAREVIVPFELEWEMQNITFTVPQRGDKKKLLDLSLRNVKQYKLDLLKKAEKLNPDQRMMRILTTLQKDLGLHELPMHIECFDNSNIQGNFPVAACVVFKKAKPSKKDYRHFNIKTVEGPNDFASMEEVLTRRYTRLINEEEPLPNLIIVDGGKGQLSSACGALSRVGVLEKVTVVGVAKRLEEIFFPGDSTPLYLDKNSDSLRLIQHLRDEAHRFGITFHRHKRSKGQTESQLDKIKGIGPKTKELLLKEYRSVKRIAETPKDELVALIGEKKTELLLLGLQ